MPNVQITQLPAAQPLTGAESVPIVQNGVTVRTTTAAISGSPSQQQTFLTLNQEPTLPNSRYLSAGTGIGLQDGGALNPLTISLNGASASLESAGDGFVVKTGGTTVTPRSFAVSGAGLSLTNGDGQAGNPTLSLTGQILSFANASANGLLTLTSGGAVSATYVQGTAGQISVSNGNGISGPPTVGLSPTAVTAGTYGAVSEIPVITVDAYGRLTSASFVSIAAGGTVTQVNTGTGLTGGPITASGTISVDTSVVATTSNSLTLTNKTISGASNTLSNIGNASLTNSSLTINGSSVSLGGSVTVSATATNALTIGTGLSGTSYNGSTAVTIAIDSTVATLSGSQTLTNKTISGASNTLSNIGNSSLTNSGVTFNGVTVALGASGTITASTTNALTIGTGLQLDTGTTFNGSAARTLSIDSTVATLSGSQTLSNKTISGSSNTLSNIGNASLTNSAVTINGSSVSLGSSTTVTATATNALTIGTGLSGTSYNGSTAVTVAIDSTVATLSGSQTLTNKTLSGSSNTLSNIGNSSLTNSSINVLYTNGASGDASVALGGTLNLSLSAVPNSSLANSAVTIGTTAISLGSSSLTLGGLTSVAVTQDPTSALQLATKQYVDGVAQGLNVKASVLWGTTANITLSGLGTQAGGEWTGTLTAGDRILVKNQSASADNGVYAAASSGWTRTADADTWNELVSAFVFVQDGATLADTGWVCTVNPGGTLGVTAVTWSQFSGAGTYTAGTGLTLTGTQFSLTNPVAVNLGGSGLSSYTIGDMIYASGVTSLSKLALGTQGYVLTAGASGPSWGGISGGTF